MINIKDVLVLEDDNEYVVVSKTEYNNIDYYYLLDKYNNQNVKFCYIEGDEVVEVNDTDLIKKLMPLLFDEVKGIVVDCI